MGRLFGLIACLFVAFIIFYGDAKTPQPLPATAPSDQFSAGRAMVDIAAMAPVPHPIGSPANAKVRDYVFQRMTQLGLAPRIFSGEGQYVRDIGMGRGPLVSAGQVEDVIGVIPGRDRAAPALALMAHYDSVPGSPGAADDVTGVASALEIARIIRAKGVPARDVMLVITDGEEVGLLGAHAFFDGDPAARHVGFVINMEARGGGGRAYMFQTGDDNGAAIDLYRKTAVRPSSNSLTVFVYKVQPNDTDYTVAKSKGVPGFNYAFLGRQFDYHSPSSTVAALDQGSVQHMGAQVLPTALALAFAHALPAKAPDVVYGNIVGPVVVAYPTWVGWVLLVVAAGLIATATLRAARQDPVPWQDVAQGAGAGLLLLVAGALALHLTRHATGVGFGWTAGRALLARFPHYEVAMGLSGLGVILLVRGALARGHARVVAAALALVAGLVSILFGVDNVALMLGFASAILSLIVFGRAAGGPGSWIGLLLTGLVAAVAVQVVAPTIGSIIAWPMAAGALCAALTAGGLGDRPIAISVAIVIVTLTLAWLGGLFHGLLQGLDVPEAPALTLWLAAMVLWPLALPPAAARLAGFVPGTAALAMGLGISVWLHATSPWTPRHPQHTTLLYVVDEATGKAWRGTPFDPDPWTRGVLTAQGARVTRQTFGDGYNALWAAPAPLVAVTPPTIAVTHGADGVVTLHAAPEPGASLALFLRANTVVASASLDGRPAPLLGKPGQMSPVIWAAGAAGVTIAFRPAGPGALDIRYAQTLPQWPAQAPPPPRMPATLMPWDASGSTVVLGSQRATW